MSSAAVRLPLEALRARFGERLQENVRLANYTSARVGGLADGLLVVRSADELAQAAETLWDAQVPFVVLGSAANVLVSDQGYRGIVVLNRAHTIKIDVSRTPPSVWAESGANLGSIARRIALRGLSGLEWAATVPGSLGGAVYGNAGAHGSDMQTNLLLAEILHPELGRQQLSCAQMEYSYRSSILKRSQQKAVILSARLWLEPDTPENIKAKMDTFSAHRKTTQPPGASMGSMFKNPPGDYAGRLVETCGLKGMRVGGVEVSKVHANFFVNHENATASDYRQLIERARAAVAEKHGVELELEIEFIGEWQD